MIDGRNFFDQSIKNDLKTYNNTRKIQLVKVMITQDYPYFKKYFKLIAIDLSEQQKVGADILLKI